MMMMMDFNINLCHENKEIYRIKAKEARREVRKAKNQAWKEWSKEIETNEGRLKM